MVCRCEIPTVADHVSRMEMSSILPLSLSPIAEIRQLQVRDRRVRSFVGSLGGGGPEGSARTPTACV